MNRKAFTLIELLVVIAIIAILAAILFPVFSQAREQARKTVCISNLKQLGLSLLMYAQDYDEQTCPWRTCVEGDPWNPGGSPAEPHDSENFGTSWDRLIQPYLKNNYLTSCPSDKTPGDGEFNSALSQHPGGGKSARSYEMVGSMGGHWCPDTPPRKLADVPKPTQTLYITEGDNCAAPVDPWGADPRPVWNWCAVNDLESQTAFRHNHTSPFLFVDGHVKVIPWQEGQEAKAPANLPQTTGIAGLYRFRGYDWSRTDGSLFAAYDPIPGGGSLLIDPSLNNCPRVLPDIKADPND